MEDGIHGLSGGGFKTEVPKPAAERNPLHQALGKLNAEDFETFKARLRGDELAEQRTGNAEFDAMWEQARGPAKRPVKSEAEIAAELEADAAARAYSLKLSNMTDAELAAHKDEAQMRTDLIRKYGAL